MDILSAILNAQNGAAADRVGSQVGLGPDQTTAALTAPAGGGIVDMLTPLLDQNRNGSIVDDVTSMIGRFMKQS